MKMGGVSLCETMMVNKVTLDPSVVRHALIADSTRRSESCSRSHWRPDFYQRFVSCVPADSQFPPVSDGAESNTSSGTG